MVDPSVLHPQPYVPPQGNACNNTQDLAVFKRFHDKFDGILEACSKMYIGDADMITHCLVAGTNNSLPCGECFGTESHCDAVHFPIQCLVYPESKVCVDCVRKHCYPTHVDCAGVDPSVIPPEPYISNQCNGLSNTQNLDMLKKIHYTFHRILEVCSKSTLLMLIKQHIVWW